MLIVGPRIGRLGKGAAGDPEPGLRAPDCSPSSVSELPAPRGELRMTAVAPRRRPVGHARGLGAPIRLRHVRRRDRCLRALSCRGERQAQGDLLAAARRRRARGCPRERRLSSRLLRRGRRRPRQRLTPAARGPQSDLALWPPLIVAPACATSNAIRPGLRRGPSGARRYSTRGRRGCVRMQSARHAPRSGQ